MPNRPGTTGGPAASESPAGQADARAPKSVSWISPVEAPPGPGETANDYDRFETIVGSGGTAG